MTIARYALLDALECQFIKPKEEIDPLSVLYGIYIMHISNADTKKQCLENIDQLKKNAVSWANSRNIVKWLNNNMAQVSVMILEQLKAIYYVIPDISSDQHSTKSSNGWLAQMMYAAVKDFNISVDDAVYEVPLAKLMLLLRQKHFNDSKGEAMTLQDKETIDKMEK